jgi:hypothetical protein
MKKDISIMSEYICQDALSCLVDIRIVDKEVLNNVNVRCLSERHCTIVDFYLDLHIFRTSSN